MINDNQFYNTILINLIQVLYSFLKKKNFDLLSSQNFAKF